jgi:hypothetical protein
MHHLHPLIECYLNANLLRQSPDGHPAYAFQGTAHTDKLVILHSLFLTIISVQNQVVYSLSFECE